MLKRKIGWRGAEGNKLHSMTFLEAIVITTVGDDDGWNQHRYAANAQDVLEF